MYPTPLVAEIEPDVTCPAPTLTEIDLAALRHNVQFLQETAGPAQILGVVKSNAYGHGAVRVARVLRDEGVEYLGVARLNEALQLREAGINGKMLVFGAPLPAYLPTYAGYDLDVTVPSQAVAEAAVTTAREVGPLRVHVKVDTGMGRIGLPPEETASVVRLLETAPGITLAGLWTHLATATERADAFALQQLDRFAPILRELGDTFETIHIANSGALFTLTDRVTFDRALVRLGLSLYGLTTTPGAEALRPVMRFTSRVTQVKTVEAGSNISYRRTWQAPSRTRIATVAAGYGDGYQRVLSNRGTVCIGGRRYPIVGAVCMDMLMIDLGPPGGPGDVVREGDEVVLFGKGGPSALEVADWAGTIPYEVCCGVAARVPRRYID